MENNSKLNKIPSKLNEMTKGFKNKQRNKFNPKIDKGTDTCTLGIKGLGYTFKIFPLWRINTVFFNLMIFRFFDLFLNFFLLYF